MFSNLFNGAKAQITGSSEYPNINGFVTFKETKDGVLVTAKINGLPKTNGKCKRKILRTSYT